MQAAGVCKDYRIMWQRWENKFELKDISKEAGAKQKLKNMIVKAWPFQIPTNATVKEFWDSFAAGASGSERYLEWTRFDG